MVVVILLGGCIPTLPLFTAANCPVEMTEGCGCVTTADRSIEEANDCAPIPPRSTPATMSIEQLDHGVFVGVAMSGGGMRAANFSAAALLQLERMGLLDKVAAISSVSGSSLIAGYYGLFRNDAERWNRPVLEQKLAQDLQSEWLSAWLAPWNWSRYWFTNFDRSDIMTSVFDEYLFDGRTFGDMPLDPSSPRILINATSLTNRGGFAFTDESFKELGSRLDVYPVSHAVMASGAFPGAFHNVTLRNFAVEDTYEHLFDGGPVDNLGVGTLEKLLAGMATDQPGRVRAKQCLLIVVDAYPGDPPRGQHDRDTRQLVEFAFDTNAIDASDILLTVNRQHWLERLGVEKDNKIEGDLQHVPFSSYRPFPQSELECHVWHINFERLDELGFEEPEKLCEPEESQNSGLKDTVNDTPTAYRLPTWSRKNRSWLNAPFWCDLVSWPEQTDLHQKALFSAAEILMTRDREVLEKLCGRLHEWFDHEFEGGCVGSS